MLGKGLRGRRQREQRQEERGEKSQTFHAAPLPAAMMRSILALVAEVDLGRVLRARRRLERNLGLGAVENLGADRVREGADAGIIGLDCLIIVAALGSDAVLGPF